MYYDPIYICTCMHLYYKPSSIKAVIPLPSDLTLAISHTSLLDLTRLLAQDNGEHQDDADDHDPRNNDVHKRSLKER